MIKVSHLRNIIIAWLALGLAACQPASAATLGSTSEPAAGSLPGAVTQPAAINLPGATITTAPALAPETGAIPATSPPEPAAARQPRSIWLPAYLPQRLRDAAWLPSGWSAAADAQSAGLRLDITSDSTQVSAAIPWIYALVAPFPTVADDLSSAELRTAWKDTPANDAPFQKLLVDGATAVLFTRLWGSPGPAVQLTATEQRIDTAWTARTTWAIVPFEQLEPRWKVISVDGQSPVRKDFQPARYPLQVSFVLAGDPGALAAFKAAQSSLPESNRQANHLTTVVVTGTTALVRGTASLMEQRGMDYPAQDIAGWLREADILHISNEVAFWKTCPAPDNWVGLTFCSRTKYIKLLEDIGTDVVELTGDHFQDWGPEAVLFTLDLYKKEGWKTYGGGANLDEARQPALFEHNGNKIAFLGCNAKPKGYATVSEKTPGTLHCDIDQMAAEVQKLRADGYQPIVTFQHLEYYSYTAHPILQKDFRQMADAGAAIVSGSQAHQPQALEFKDGALLHYGLGNLFFDQTNQGDAPRTAFIDRHVFYEGRLISTELLTIYLVDYARSRPMTLPERQQLLKIIFKASGW